MTLWAKIVDNIVTNVEDLYQSDNTKGWVEIE